MRTHVEVTAECAEELEEANIPLRPEPSVTEITRAAAVTREHFCSARALYMQLSNTAYACTTHESGLGDVIFTRTEATRRSGPYLSTPYFRVSALSRSTRPLRLPRVFPGHLHNHARGDRAAARLRNWTGFLRPLSDRVTDAFSLVSGRYRILRKWRTDTSSGNVTPSGATKN